MHPAEIRNYDLPDSAMFEDSAPDAGAMIWQPAHTCIVLGASNRPEVSLNMVAAVNDRIEIYKRPSGGEAVVLSPNVLVISMLFRNVAFGNSQTWFRNINSRIMAALSGLGVKDMSYRGISDIAIGEKKILGSGIYRKKTMLFYHAVLNIAEPVSTMTKYLRHPGREPDYRKGRTHEEFVTSLSDEGYDFSHDILRIALRTELGKMLKGAFWDQD